MRRPIVVKLGTSLVAGPGGRVRRGLLRARAREIGELVRGGRPTVVVSSGAIALGLPRLGLDRRPRRVPRLQAASALGQARLQAAWEAAFSREVIAVAQVLLTAADMAVRTAYVNARNALDELFRLGAVPIVNENDATATDEITFGDNDALAAQIAVLTGAQLLVLLTEVQGVYTHAPGSPGAELLEEGGLAFGAAFGEGTPFGRGGMQSKVLAAQLASAAGIPTVIAAGHGDEVLGPIVAGERRGTRFASGGSRDSAFKLWLRYCKPSAGRLLVDDGARRAVVEQGGSLLAAGVVGVEGSFGPGDAVDLVGQDGSPFAKGIAEAPPGELSGRPRGVEAVHRNRLVLI